MEKLRVGVIGTGAFAETCHLPGLQSHPKAEVVAIYGRRYDQARMLANRMHVPDVHTDFHELCARTDIDAVTIVTPNVAHYSQAKAALAASKHVFCEKPLAMSVMEASEMLWAAEASGKVHQVAFTFRYLFGVQELRRRLRQGDIGEPYYLRIQFDTWDGLHPSFTIGFREKVRLSGGGVLYDLGSHFFDLARFILGPIVSVTGFTKLVPRLSVDASTGILTEVETDDIAGAWVLFANGAHGQWFASRVTACTSERAYVEVTGREGSLRASLSRGSVDMLRVSRPTAPAWEVLPLPELASDGRPHCLGIMMRSFVDACMRCELDGNIDASFYDGFAAQLSLEAVNTASSEHRWVSIGPNKAEKTFRLSA